LYAASPCWVRNFSISTWVSSDTGAGGAVVGAVSSPGLFVAAGGSDVVSTVMEEEFAVAVVVAVVAVVDGATTVEGPTPTILLGEIATGPALVASVEGLGTLCSCATVFDRGLADSAFTAWCSLLTSDCRKYTLKEL